MNARVGLIVAEITALLQTLYNRNASLKFQDTLQALECMRYMITEQALRRGHPELMHDDPADRKRKGGSNAPPPPPKDRPLV